MAVTYTNRKGRKYYLCQGITKTGKPRYYFSREQKDKAVEKIPEGYEIRESVNGIVSLAKRRPKLLTDEEIAVVEAALKKHPEGKRYRLGVKFKEMAIYEAVGPDLEELAKMMAKEFGFSDARVVDFNRRMEKEHDIYTQYTPVMKFILSDKEKRLFDAERMCYLGSIDDFIGIDYDKTIEELAGALIPKLGTDALFELF
ncbi:MAG: hypothetical protein K8R77_00815 [Anaerolineaceae bacterium]|nr:hypothetical protein [Anaerolineaceae bacterium]